MSTTYYWYRPRQLDPDAYRNWIDDCRKIVQHASVGTADRAVIIRGPEGTGEPVINDSLIAINGDAAAGLECEPFVVPRILAKEFRDRADEEGRIFKFCKVAGRPYESVVAGCLAAFDRRFGTAVRVEADAAAASKLAAGRELAGRLSR